MAETKDETLANLMKSIRDTSIKNDVHYDLEVGGPSFACIG